MIVPHKIRQGVIGFTIHQISTLFLCYDGKQDTNYSRWASWKGVHAMSDKPTPLYPAMLRLSERLCVVVGGGEVALRKVKNLLAAGAKIRVISPHIVPEIAAYAREGCIEYLPRVYLPGDAAQGFLVIAATNQRQVNQTVADEADTLGKLVNVVDDPAQCSFMVPAQYIKDGLQIAVSTQGQDPAAAKHLKNVLATDFARGTRGFQDEVEQWWQQQKNM
jgi:precorrin-2 dehydrogenase/sirohydrochlorin ferrochelatase